ncbi:hypothetical protein B0I37DRAFT_418431 [Chaetomium sp. MPI-CAGE-AT-0009]|nr:hypothetical protein B0I37DRAFT_418431 [Chaetomium sp. MPI-CAGE-AT-0009]
MNRHVRGGDRNSDDGDGSQGRHWACPFYLFNPILHDACARYKLARVPDIRQHIERNHAEEAGEQRIKEMKRKGGRGMTNVDRWYALWALFFPSHVRPATPYYTGTQFADLSVLFISGFMEGQKDGLSPDEKAALMRYIDFVKTATQEMKSGRISIQDVTDLSEHQTQGTEIQDSNTYQGLPLLPNQLGPTIMGPPQRPNPREFFPGYHGTQTSNVPPQPQAPSMHVVDSQLWPHFANPAAYSTVSAHRLPPVASVDAAATNGLLDYPVDSSGLSGAMDWASAGDSEHGGGVAQFGFGYGS